MSTSTTQPSPPMALTAHAGPVDVTRSRRRLLAFAPALSAVILCAGSALTPAGLDRPIMSTSTAAQVLSIAADHVGRLYFSNLLLLFGLGLLSLAYGSMASLVRSRGAALASPDGCQSCSSSASASPPSRRPASWPFPCSCPSPPR